MTKDPKEPQHPELSPAERIEAKATAFLQLWLRYSYPVRSKAEIKALKPKKIEVLLPNQIDWAARAVDVDETKFGELTINPDTVNIDWKSIPESRFEIIALPNMVGQRLSVVAKYVAETYGDRYHILGLEFWHYLYTKRGNDRDPSYFLKDEVPYYFFGSTIRHTSGEWFIPNIIWVMEEYPPQWTYVGGSLNYEHEKWMKVYKVVLLKKE